MSIVYDAGVLVAADRNDRRVWADHRVRLEMDLIPTTTSPVVAQVSRSPRQVQLRRFLRGCLVESFRVEHAHDVGALLSKAGTTDVIDAHVVITAAAVGAAVLTSDPTDMQHLADQLATPIHVRAI